MTTQLLEGFVTYATAEQIVKRYLAERVDEANSTMIHNFTAPEGECLVCAFTQEEFTCDEVATATMYYSHRAVPHWSGYWAQNIMRDTLGNLFQFRTILGEDVIERLAIVSDDEYVSPITLGEVEDTILHRVRNFWERLASHDSSSMEVQVCPAHYNRCDLCEGLYVVSARGTASLQSWGYDSEVCQSCAESHAYCELGEHFTQDNMYYWRGDQSCWECISDRGGAFCDDCDDVYHMDYGCENCGQNAYGAIHSYSYKPDPRFRYVLDVDGDLSTERSRVGKVFMGLEIEVEAVDCSVKKGVEVLQANLDSDERYIYLKHDGSLNNGFEIVTHPCTLASHKSQNLQAFQMLANAGFRGWKTSTCGIHVHVNRDAFNGVPHQWRWTRMFAHNQSQFVALAGRDSAQWASFREMKEKLSWAFKHQHGRGDNRYEAINLCNWNTFEVRIFRSSLKPERIMMIVELIDATVEYTRHLTIREMADHALEWSRFASWVRAEQAEKYPNLITFCDKYSL